MNRKISDKERNNVTKHIKVTAAQTPKDMPRVEPKGEASHSILEKAGRETEAEASETGAIAHRPGPETTEPEPTATSAEPLEPDPGMSDPLTRILPILQRSFEQLVAENGGKGDWELALCQRDQLVSVGGSSEFLRGFIVGIADALGVSVTDMLSRLTYSDGAAVVTRHRDEKADREHAAYVLGVSAGEVSYYQLSIEVRYPFLDDEANVETLQALTDARASNGIIGDGEETAAFDRGWWDAVRAHAQDLSEKMQGIMAVREESDAREAARMQRLRERVSHGHRLRRLRERCGFSVMGLQKLTGVAQRRIQAAETGDEVLSAEETFAIASLFQRVSAALGFDAAA